MKISTLIPLYILDFCRYTVENGMEKLVIDESTNFTWNHLNPVTEYSFNVTCEISDVRVVKSITARTTRCSGMQFM